MKRRLQLAGLAALAALVIAILLRDVVEQVVVRPILYLLWILSLIYRFIPQPVLWLLVVLGMAYLVLIRLAGNIKLTGRGLRSANPVYGPVDELARRIERKDGGIYFKWQIAHILGQIAADLQELRLHNRSRKLELEQTDTPPQVLRYIEAGLYTSFSDYPIPGWLPLLLNNQPARPTPFDLELDPVIEFLESEMESENGLRRP